VFIYSKYLQAVIDDKREKVEIVNICCFTVIEAIFVFEVLWIWIIVFDLSAKLNGIDSS